MFLKYTRQEAWQRQTQMVTTSQYQFLIIKAGQNWFATAKHFRYDLNNASVVNACTQSVHRRLHEGNMRLFSPCIKIL
jgi:hypothetical protein